VLCAAREKVGIQVGEGGDPARVASRVLERERWRGGGGRTSAGGRGEGGHGGEVGNRACSSRRGGGEGGHGGSWSGGVAVIVRIIKPVDQAGSTFFRPCTTPRSAINESIAFSILSHDIGRLRHP
jgi:hypothetical protein